MRRSYAVAVIAALLISHATPSLANRSAADACAAKLPANAKLVYAAAIGSVAPGVDLVETIRGKARSLVMAGKLDRAQAQSAGQAAGACLKQAL